MTALADGGFVATWGSDDPGDGSGCIRARVFDADRNPTGADFVVNTTTANDQIIPSVTALADGGFVVTWESTDTGDGSGECIRARVFDADGNPTGDDFIVNTTTTDDQVDVSVTALDDGGFVVTWTHNNGLSYDIVARIFDADGTPREVNGSTTLSSSGPPATTRSRRVTALPNGNFAVAYTDSGWGNEDTGITLTIVGPDGAIVNPYVHVNTPSDPAQRVRSRHHRARQRLHRRLLDRPGIGNSDIMCRIFDEDGVPIDLFGGAPIAAVHLAGYGGHQVGGLGHPRGPVHHRLAGQRDRRRRRPDLRRSSPSSSATPTAPRAADTLNGDALRDSLDGDAGDDTLIGGGGKDTLEGGANDDTAEYSRQDRPPSPSRPDGQSRHRLVADCQSPSRTSRRHRGSAADTLTGDNLANASGGGDASTIPFRRQRQRHAEGRRRRRHAERRQRRRHRRLQRQDRRRRRHAERRPVRRR